MALRPSPDGVQRWTDRALPTGSTPVPAPFGEKLFQRNKREYPAAPPESADNPRQPLAAGIQCPRTRSRLRTRYNQGSPSRVLRHQFAKALLQQSF